MSKNKIAKILRARELRKEQTAAEEYLWCYLRDRRFIKKKFRRQHVFEGFILDFYCPEEHLAVELDGSIHLKRKDQDAERQALLESSSIKVLRFKNNDVLSDIKGALKVIKNHLA